MTALKIITLLSIIATPTFTLAKTLPTFKITCDVELTNGGTPKLITAESKLFTATMGTPTDSSSPVTLKIGPYTLLTQIQEISQPATPGVAVRPPSNPQLAMNIFEKSPIADSIFRANVEGFDWADFKRPLVLSGFQFREFTHENVKYTRMDYACRLVKVNSKTVPQI